MVDVYGTKVKLTELSEDDEGKFTSHPMFRVTLNGDVIGHVVNNPAGWYAVYLDGDVGLFRTTRREVLNNLIAFAEATEWNARRAICATS